jgi:uncharacterized membrane protein
MLLELADKLQDNSIIIALTSTGWSAALIAILHYYSMFVLVGSMAIVNLSVLGLVGTDKSAASMAKRIFPWAWASLAVNVVSGFIMFAGDATAYVPTKSFSAKILVVLSAIVLSIVLQRRIPTWDQSPIMPTAARVLAVVSILFWVGAILMGVEVPALSGVG